MALDNIFSTPLGRYEILSGSDQMTSDLANHLYEIEEEFSGDHDPYSLKGKSAFHSPANLVFGDDRTSVALRRMIFDVCRLYADEQDIAFPPDLSGLKKFDCWGVILRQGDYSTTHSHPDCKFSGVLYVKIPESMSEEEGNLVLIDPRPGARSSGLYGSRIFQVKPEQGVMYCFPNWLEHYVESHSCEGDRISISWNIDW